MTLASPPLLEPQAFTPPVRRSVVLRGISWSLYQSMLAEIRSGAIRLTYDQGWLEIMTLSPLHEKVKTILARLIEAYADANGIDAEGLGSTTFSREELKRGLEPDECYYIAHAADVTGKNELDLSVDPPPDLAIEVDISPPDIAKQPIYAALGVPEVWRYDGRRVIPLLRAADGYIESEKSIAFPNLPMDRLNEFLSIGLASSQSAAVRAMRSWLRAGTESAAGD
jgi:Uma2 family endonuclease